MGIESQTPPTNVAVTGVMEPVANGSLPSAVTDARFTVASRWIDISGLTSVASGLDYTALKRVCYLFVPIDRAKVGTSRVRCTYCRHCGRASRVAARDAFSPPASSRPTRQRGRIMSPQIFFCACIVATRLDTPVISASAFDTALRGRF